MLTDEKEGARTDMVKLFALLHNHERLSDFGDMAHGAPAVINATLLRNKYFDIDNEGSDLLTTAMRGHSSCDMKGDITIQTCYDADRLDLGRIGVMPLTKYLCTTIAKDPAFIQAALNRSIKN